MEMECLSAATRPDNNFSSSSMTMLSNVPRALGSFSQTLGNDDKRASSGLSRSMNGARALMWCFVTSISPPLSRNALKCSSNAASYAAKSFSLLACAARLSCCSRRAAINLPYFHSVVTSAFLSSACLATDAAKAEACRASAVAMAASQFSIAVLPITSALSTSISANIFALVSSTSCPTMPTTSLWISQRSFGAKPKHVGIVAKSIALQGSGSDEKLRTN
mmetsp:Transcript_120885/g.341816  ORF Transcript_120885/g.341816 Transcript_120885/m.341816 type:complete len:221 (-) Transcript_120885:185-847(-)